MNIASKPYIFRSEKSAGLGSDCGHKFKFFFFLYSTSFSCVFCGFVVFSSSISGLWQKSNSVLDRLYKIVIVVHSSDLTGSYKFGTILGNSKVQYNIHDRSPLVSILSQINRVHTIPSHPTPSNHISL
jgi:hypothetical protein